MNFPGCIGALEQMYDKAIGNRTGQIVGGTGITPTGVGRRFMLTVPTTKSRQTQSHRFGFLPASDKVLRRRPTEGHLRNGKKHVVCQGASIADSKQGVLSFAYFLECLLEDGLCLGIGLGGSERCGRGCCGGGRVWCRQVHSIVVPRTNDVMRGSLMV